MEYQSVSSATSVEELHHMPLAQLGERLAVLSGLGPNNLNGDATPFVQASQAPPRTIRTRSEMAGSTPAVPLQRLESALGLQQYISSSAVQQHIQPSLDPADTQKADLAGLEDLDLNIKWESLDLVVAGGTAGVPPATTPTKRTRRQKIASCPGELTSFSPNPLEETESNDFVGEPETTPTKRTKRGTGHRRSSSDSLALRQPSAEWTDLDIVKEREQDGDETRQLLSRLQAMCGFDLDSLPTEEAPAGVGASSGDPAISSGGQEDPAEDVPKGEEQTPSLVARATKLGVNRALLNNSDAGHAMGWEATHRKETGDGVANTGGEAGGPIDPKTEERMARNRESAKKSFQMKKKYVEDLKVQKPRLERRMAELAQRNQGVSDRNLELRAQIHRLQQELDGKSRITQHLRLLSPHQPANGVLPSPIILPASPPAPSMIPGVLSPTSQGSHFTGDGDGDDDYPASPASGPISVGSPRSPDILEDLVDPQSGPVPPLPPFSLDGWNQSALPSQGSHFTGDGDGDDDYPTSPASGPISVGSPRSPDILEDLVDPQSGPVPPLPTFSLDGWSQSALPSVQEPAVPPQGLVSGGPAWPVMHAGMPMQPGVGGLGAPAAGSSYSVIVQMTEHDFQAYQAYRYDQLSMSMLGCSLAEQST